jgi:hypothetical protein
MVHRSPPADAPQRQLPDTTSEAEATVTQLLSECQLQPPDGPCPRVTLQRNAEGTAIAMVVTLPTAMVQDIMYKARQPPAGSPLAGYLVLRHLERAEWQNRKELQAQCAEQLRAEVERSKAAEEKFPRIRYFNDSRSVDINGRTYKLEQGTGAEAGGAGDGAPARRDGAT